MSWTKEQQRAIETRGKNLLVAAAAGSGKTAVLVERIIQQLLNGDCDVDRMLVVTFTHAAADEMRMRMETAIRKQLELETDEKKQERLERQMVLLSGASITTMHSFCQSIVRQNFSAIDLDPEFRLAADERELDMMKQDALSKLFEEEYERGDEVFLHFADDFGGNERGDESLYRLLLDVYKYAQSQPFPEVWLESLSKQFSFYENQELWDTPWFSIVKQDVRLELEPARQECTKMMELIEEHGIEAYRETALLDKELLDKIYAEWHEENWEGLHKSFLHLNFERLGQLRGVDDSIKAVANDCIKPLRESYKKRLNGLKERYFFDAADIILEDMRLASPDVKELCRLTIRFSEKFAESKREKCVADFNDLEHFAIRILCADEKPKDGMLLRPSEIARALQEKFQTVMVDEYQDTNGVQEVILSLVSSTNTPNLFCVGDVKQSIYRFRLADPTLFLRKYKEYPQLGAEFERINLSKNFRSRPEILDCINDIFAQVMVPGTMEMEYDKEAALYHGLEYPPCCGNSLAGPSEIILVHHGDSEESFLESQPIKGDEENSEEIDKIDGLALEAQLIADRLHSLMKKDTMVFDKNTEHYRKMCWRDAVILLRSMKGVADKILDVLRQNNIPAYAATDGGYFEAQEIRTMLSLLSVLDNAHQDIPLAAVLTSPMGGMSFEELAMLRVATKEEDLYAALLQAGDPETQVSPMVQEKAEAFLRKLSGWRSLLRELSVPQLIWKLYRDTGYYDYVGCLKGGLLKQANLRMLADRAAEYEKTNYRGLFRFLRFVDRMQEMDSDLAAARTLGESEDVVRIMTIHKSKGLEFPIVFVAAMGKNFNERSASEQVLLHREYGLGPYCVNYEARFRYPTFARQAIASKIRQEGKAEEMRILYVALTRAREKLILVGTLSRNGSVRRLADRWSRYVGRKQVQLPDYASLSARSYLEWVVAALMHHRDGEVLRKAVSDPCEWSPFLDYEDSSHWEISLVQTGTTEGSQPSNPESDALLEKVKKMEQLESTEYRDEVRRLLNWQYDLHDLEQVPAKLSVTELKQRFSEQEDGTTGLLSVSEEQTWKRPAFLQEKKGLTGAEYGTLLHTVMQHVDARGDLSYEGIKKQLEQLAKKEIFPQEQMPIIHIKTVQGFFLSKLGERLRNAKNVWRELPFSCMIPAQQFYAQAKDEELFVQGIIDLLFEEKDGSLILVDYKTDKNTEEKLVKQKYQLQLRIYSQVTEQILGRRVQEKYLYLLHDGKIMKVD